MTLKSNRSMRVTRWTRRVHTRSNRSRFLRYWHSHSGSAAGMPRRQTTRIPSQTLSRATDHGTEKDRGLILHAETVGAWLRGGRRGGRDRDRGTGRRDR